MVSYPESLICPHCKNAIRLDYTGRDVFTTDVQTFYVRTPTAITPGRAVKSGKQTLKMTGLYITYCTQCNAILGTSNWTYG
ncbi:MAG: hypothetical protein ACFFCS_27115 [Candidatus Hodarchaeota archaeon]